MLSPEAQGELGKGQVELRLEAQKRDNLDFKDDTVDNSIDRADTIYAVAPVGEIGLFNIMDIYIQPHTRAPTVLGLKFQLLGKQRKEAGKGNFSTSLLVGYGSNSQESAASDDLSDFFSGNVDRIQMDTQHEEVGLIFGYRWSEKFLHYANFVYQKDRIEGKVTTDSGTLDDTDFKYNHDGMIYSTGFILYFGSAQWKVDYSYATSDWSKTQLQTVNSVSTAIGFNW